MRYCSQPCRSKAALARMYGLTIKEYQQVIQSMGGKCPLCKKTVRKWHMDHNHETGETFGPVCSPCNTKLIAWSFHDPELAERLVEYLKNPPVREMFGTRYVTAKKVTATENSEKYRDAGRFPHGKRRQGNVVRRKKGKQ